MAIKAVTLVTAVSAEVLEQARKTLMTAISRSMSSLRGANRPDWGNRRSGTPFAKDSRLSPHVVKKLGQLRALLEEARKAKDAKAIRNIADRYLDMKKKKSPY